MEGDRDQSSSSSPLFWSQSRKASSFSAPPPSSGIRTWVLVLLVSIFVILFIPSFRSSNFLSFRPSFVKNGWDTLNIALVVFAILCGLLGRDVASGSGGGGEYKEEGEKITVSSPPPLTHSQHQWVAIGCAPVPEQSVYEANQTLGIRRFRSSSSYPDLRQEFNNGDNWAMSNSWRFSDDIQLYRRRPSDYSEWEISGDPGVKTIQVDTFELKKSPSKSPPPPPPPPPPRPRFSQPTQPNRRTVKKLQHTQPAITTPPPPPPPPPPVFPEQKKKSNKKRSGAAAKDIATAIALFYTKKKRRSKAKKINEDDSLASASPVGPPPPPPPPPPPLQSSSVFSQLFLTKKGGGKSRRFNSISGQRSPPAPPPPPPPPLPPKKQPSLFSDHNLPPRKKREKIPTYINAYPIAPPSPLPPPPPPPPPGSDEDGSDAHFADGAKASPFCPSPDVNNKADVFIKHFRDGLKLEKLNSIREKQQRREDQPQEMQQEAGIEMEMEHQIMKMMMMGMEEDNWTPI